MRKTINQIKFKTEIDLIIFVLKILEKVFIEVKKILTNEQIFCKLLRNTTIV
jgi:hypothetical protein